jgi:hypothetical protein
MNDAIHKGATELMEWAAPVAVATILAAIGNIVSMVVMLRQRPNERTDRMAAQIGEVRDNTITMGTSLAGMKEMLLEHKESSDRRHADLTRRLDSHDMRIRDVERGQGGNSNGRHPYRQ